MVRKAARTRVDPIPAYRPQLAQLVKEAPAGSAWLHELKYDGYRIGCRIDGRTITLISRNGKDWTDAFPEVVRGARDLRIESGLLDGEVCMLLPDGRTSFQALQNAFSGEGPRSRLVYFVFDALHLEGRRLIGRPLEERKAALRARLARSKDGIVQYADHLDADGPDAYREACRLGAEGIVSKRRDQPYQTGKRTGWLKTKCVHRQEFVIGGFTDPEGSRQGIGALLVGSYEGRRLVFAGKVGTGFTTATARQLRGTLDSIEVRECPFAPAPAGWLGRNAHWVRPTLVCEVVFTEWTDEGKIRHPSFQGLRRDKAPARVTREHAASASAVAAPRATAATRAIRSATASAPAPAHGGAVVRGIRISNPDRLMFERPRMTKLDLVRYYDRVADAMMPHVAGRPLTLVRCGSGIAAGCLYMKHSKVWAPPALTRISIREKTKIGEYLVIETPEAIVALAQMDIVEIHTWNTRKEKIEYPDRIVIDLDPGEAIEWAAVVTSARLVRRLLHTLDLEGFVKTTGGRGLHVVVPLEPRHDWEACLAFARAVATALVRHDPDLFTTTFGKRGRERQILVDYLRNNRTNTSVAAFSTRARVGAPVSVPVSWGEVTERLRPEAFTTATVPARLERRRKDPWADYFTMKQRLPAKAVAALESV